MLIYGEEAEDKAMVKMPRYRADNRNDHHQRHFIGDLQHGGNGHGSKRHMGKSVAYERKAFQHMPSSGMMIQSHC